MRENHNKKTDAGKININVGSGQGLSKIIVSRHLKHFFIALEQAELISQTSAKDERFIRKIVDNAPNMMGYWGCDLRCRYANNVFSEWFGMPPENIIGIKFLDLVGEQLFALNEPHIRGVLAGESQRFERTLNKADGQD